MNLAVRIQATEQRKRWVDTLVVHLLNQEPHNSDIQVVVDKSHDLWSGAKATLQSYTQGFHTHVLLLQDDVLPCRDLIKTAEHLIELLPHEPITLFSNHSAITKAREAGKHWALLKKWLMAQAYIMPVEIIEDFIPWAERHIKPEIYFDDNRWAMYFDYHNRGVYATAPSLVEHLGWNSTTLNGGYDPGHTFSAESRMAKWFIGFEHSGLEIDWGNPHNYFEAQKTSNGDWAHYYRSEAVDTHRQVVPNQPDMRKGAMWRHKLNYSQATN